MRINIAGAGAGKTTKMADRIICCYETLAENFNIYCVAFTNSAVECIQGKLKKHFGFVPLRIKVTTIHSFLYQEIIKPYYYLLFDKHYDRVINIDLPSNPQKRNMQISELEKSNILIVDVIPERAKWVMVKKSDDNKRKKDIRRVIQSTFMEYCGALFVDESQDIDHDFFEIIRVFESMNIQMELMGDPKQDLKGFDRLRALVDFYPENVHYITECHRCPQTHLRLSNAIIRDTEKQHSSIEQGEITVVFESECSVQSMMDESYFDLMYISARNERYETHRVESVSTPFSILFTDLVSVYSVKYKNYNKTNIERCAFIKTESLINAYLDFHDAGKAMLCVFSSNPLERKDYARVIQHLQSDFDINLGKIHVNSIDYIKGKEGRNCLFILTRDLAEYLFAKRKDENKTKNKLYVALTRSLEKLTILITLEVEKKHGRDFICNYMESLIKSHASVICCNLSDTILYYT